MAKSTDAKLYKRTKTVKGKEYESWVARQYHNSKPIEASGPTQIEALQKLAQKITDIESGAIGISSKMTVSRWAYEWLDTYKKPVVADKQYNDYKRQLDKKIIPKIGALCLSEVKSIHIQKIMNSMEGKSSSRAKKLKNTLCAMFRQARACGLIRIDPAEFVTMPKVTSGTHRSITPFEREHFLTIADTHHAGLMFKVMLYCGLRTGEVVALDWRDIDFDKQRIKVSRALESNTDKIKSTKTESGIRDVPLPSEICNELSKRYNELLERKADSKIDNELVEQKADSEIDNELVEQKADSEIDNDLVEQKADSEIDNELAESDTDLDTPVFLQAKGGLRHTHSSRHKAWASLKKCMDISMGAVYEKRKAKDGKMRLTKVQSIVAPDFVPYCLRHTYCTDLQEKGVPINVAKYLMGHKDISVTASIYTHMSEKVIEDAAKRINCGQNHGEENEVSQIC